jgi:hypothetical protein
MSKKWFALRREERLRGQPPGNLRPVLHTLLCSYVPAFQRKTENQRPEKPEVQKPRDTTRNPKLMPRLYGLRLFRAAQRTKSSS